MFDPERLLGQMMGGALGGAFGGGGRRGRRSSMFSTGNVGGKAAMGVGLLGIAIAAFEHFNDKSKASGAQPMSPADLAAASSSGAMPPPPPPPGSALPQTPPPPPAPARAALGMDARARDMVLMVQAMIAAAAADGRIDDVERARILERAESAGIDAETRDFLQRELDAPMPLKAIVARTRPELAGDVYAASLIAITSDTPEEQRYLDELASALKLDGAARDAIHTQLEGV
jgi:uncharacterized membrane protein YebE (DUF533 family)